MTRELPLILRAHAVSFRDDGLLRLALTHASKSGQVNNQRLEFLGDRVLGLALADLLYRAYPGENEGALALRHAALVKAQTLATLARAHCLNDDIIVADEGRAAQTGNVDNVLADTLEALIGALYLDQGYEVCESFIAALWKEDLQAMEIPPQDPKNALQEWAQGRGLPLPVYTLAARRGPDHAPIFDVEVFVKPDHCATGQGATRRVAEKQAAAALLLKLNEPKS